MYQQAALKGRNPAIDSMMPRRGGRCITVCKRSAAYGCGVHLHGKSRRDDTLLTVCDSLRAFSLRAILLPALLFFFCANLHAQVTIGSLEEPKSGAVLDLNSTLKGGLLLSNIVLDNLYTIPHTGSGTANPFPDMPTWKFGWKTVSASVRQKQVQING
jgi:hypothetical protein